MTSLLLAQSARIVPSTPSNVCGPLKRFELGFQAFSIVDYPQYCRRGSVQAELDQERKRMSADATRRLAAIIVADVVGYSLMVGADGAGTIARVNKMWERILKPLVHENNGRVVEFIGDGALMEFPSAVNAVRAGLALQDRMRQENDQDSDIMAIELRIGIAMYRGRVVKRTGNGSRGECRVSRRSYFCPRIYLPFRKCLLTG